MKKRRLNKQEQEIALAEIQELIANMGKPVSQEVASSVIEVLSVHKDGIYLRTDFSRPALKVSPDLSELKAFKSIEHMVITAPVPENLLDFLRSSKMPIADMGLQNTDFTNNSFDFSNIMVWRIFHADNCVFPSDFKTNHSGETEIHGGRINGCLSGFKVPEIMIDDGTVITGNAGPDGVKYIIPNCVSLSLSSCSLEDPLFIPKQSLLNIDTDNLANIKIKHDIIIRNRKQVSSFYGPEILRPLFKSQKIKIAGFGQKAIFKRLAEKQRTQ